LKWRNSEQFERVLRENASAPAFCSVVEINLASGLPVARKNVLSFPSGGAGSIGSTSQDCSIETYGADVARGAFKECGRSFSD
jgi:hypothetical protein